MNVAMLYYYYCKYKNIDAKLNIRAVNVYMYS